MYLFYNVILFPDLGVDPLFLQLFNTFPRGRLISVGADINPGNAIVEAAVHPGIRIHSLCRI